ncbi:hypothetical protein ES689_00780 [Frigoribacterium sp. ACAM 257]|uniref:hypothetical protein n=1 Tax=Frigoribacterium sp. ACAM 257 TaxID=2508998 RepID=UPI0011B9BDB7|nr:hypothetical protein [Frigoribacterium sp. ACAM 257]TWX40061.1 hypothetical protein ES689_00780 [Frigoribacterium sp. ACAM 257]
MRREHDVVPGRATPWRNVLVEFEVPSGARASADRLRPLLDDPELHWTPGLRRGVLALLPRSTAMVRVVLSWEWSVEAADFSVHSLEPDPFTPDELVVLERWMRASARRLASADDAVEAAVTRVVDDVVSGLDRSAPPRSGVPRAVEGSSIGTAVLGTRVAGPDETSPHGRVDVRLPDPGDPGHEVLVDVSTGRLLGHRTTLADEGDPWAFRYVVAEADEAGEAVDDDTTSGVSTADLVHWHDQHIQRQMLADDARQALVHLLAGLDAPASVGYRG